jgi:signal peptidase I
VIALVVAAGVVALVAVFLRRRYVAVTVQGPSMEPTLHSGDLVLVRRTPLKSVRTGQIVVFRRPSAGDPRWVIKRAAAVPGETLPDLLAARLGPVVPAGSLAVLGDNPARSADSRHHGYVDGAELLGVVIRRPSP